MTNTTLRATSRQMLNKVPEVTVFFWIIKILCTTVGESFADYVNETLGFGLTNTTMVFTAALVATLVVQFRLRRYVPAVYWLAVVLISVVGTLLTDNLTDARGVPLCGQLDRVRGPARGRLRRLVRPRAHPVDPLDHHDPARGLVLARRARHLRPRHRRSATGPSSSPAGPPAPPILLPAGLIALVALGWRSGRRPGPVLLDGLHPHPPARAPTSATSWPSTRARAVSHSARWSPA